MANRRPPWNIPAIIDPPNRRCIQMMIPDDPEHIAIFWGVVRSLSDWQRWERESTKSGTLVAQVWRDVVYSIDWSKMSCCPEPTNQRYNSDGILEVSYDGGITYDPAPALDDRFSGAIQPPILGEDGSEKACAAAASAEEFVKLNLIEELTEGESYAQISAAMVALIAALGVTGIGLLVGAAAAAIFAAGVSAVQAAFTTEVWTDFRCILYCRILPDGSFDEAGWQLVKQEIVNHYDGVVEVILWNWVNAVGVVGLTNAARSGFVATADCTSCECGDIELEYVDNSELLEHPAPATWVMTLNGGTGFDRAVRRRGGGTFEVGSWIWNDPHWEAFGTPDGGSEIYPATWPGGTCWEQLRAQQAVSSAIYITITVNECTP
jgi:hypothetical protein